MGLLDKLLNRDALQKLNLKQLTKEKEKHSLEVMRLNDQIAVLEKKKSYLHGLMTDPNRNLSDRQRVQVFQDMKFVDSQVATLHNALGTVRSYISQLEMVILQKQNEALKTSFDPDEMRKTILDQKARQELEREKREQLNEVLLSAPPDPLAELSRDDMEEFRQLERERQENALRQQQALSGPEKSRRMTQRETE